MRAGEPTVVLNEVGRSYRVGSETVHALTGVSLELPAGELCSVTGPSGAGKSTLLHLIGALDLPTTGTVSVAGQELSGLPDRALSEFRLRHVGFVFQFFNLLPTLSAWENVALPRLFAGEPSRRAKQRAVRLLETVGLAHRAEHRPGELSGGQMQRVAIARALIMDPPLLLADEPTANLDSGTGADVLGLLRDLAHESLETTGSETAAGGSEARLVVLVTHDAEAAATADRRITIRDGAVEANDPLSEVVS